MGNSLRKVESDQPSAATIDMLTEIWQRVLQRSHIGPEERLYDVGANDALADKAFNEMGRAFDRPLPAREVCGTSTTHSYRTRDLWNSSQRRRRNGRAV
jgi:hypothetical protein